LILDLKNLPDGYKKYCQILKVLPDFMILERLGSKAVELQATPDSFSFDKVHNEIILITQELKERKLI